MGNQQINYAQLLETRAERKYNVKYAKRKNDAGDAPSAKIPRISDSTNSAAHFSGQQQFQQNWDQPTPSWKSNEQYSASGLKDTIHGNDYQLKLLMLFAYESMSNAKYRVRFRLATEMAEAEKFDDLVLHYEDTTGNKKYRFLQAKHKLFPEENKNKISASDLITPTNTDFSLQKYFISYLKLKNMKRFKDGLLEDFVICTNTDFGFEPIEGQCKNTKEKNKRWKNYLQELTDEDKILNLGGNRYRFKDSDDLISELTLIFEEALGKNGFPKDDISKMKEFLEKLVFAVNQPSGSDLGKVIKRKIGNEFNLINDITYNDFYSYMGEWLQNRDKNSQAHYLNDNDISRFFEESKRKISSLVAIGPTSIYRKKIKKLGVEFVGVSSELKNFLISDSNEKQVFNFINLYDTKLSAIKVNQILDDIEGYKKHDCCIFTSLEDLSMISAQLIEAFESYKNNLLIIECEPTCGKKEREIDTKVLYNQLSKIIEKSNERKTILITQPNDSLANEFINGKKEVIDDDNNFNDLVAKSQKMLLEKSVIFQGKEIELNKLINGNSKELIDTGTLVKLIKNENKEITIGNQLIGLNEVMNYYIDREFYQRERKKDIKVKSFNKSYSESGLLGHNSGHKVVIISDTAGMGKTTVLTSLSQQIKNKYPSKWVIRVDLVKYQSKLKKQESSTSKNPSMSFKFKNENEVIEFLLNNLVSLNNDLEKKLFKNSLCSASNNGIQMVILFDGFDEISPTYKDIVMDLLEGLKKSKVEKLWITTRPNMRKDLESKLGVLAYKLKPFSRGEDQVNLLVEFWEQKFEEEKNIDQKAYQKLQIYARELINALPGFMWEFTSIPLHTIMVAEVFYTNKKEEKKAQWQGCKEFIEEENKDSKKPILLLNQFNIAGLYERFIRTKLYDIHFKKEMRLDCAMQGIYNMLNREYQIFEKMHQELALYTLLNDADFKNLSSTEQENISEWIHNIESAEENKGVIDQIIDNKPHFIHQTFAEYFISEVCMGWIEKPNTNKQKFLLSNIFMAYNYNVVRSFINAKLKDKLQTLSQGALKEYGKIIKQLWSSKSNTVKGTALHIAAKDNNANIASFLLNSINEYSETYSVNFIKIKDTYEETALHYASRMGYDTTVNQLLEHFNTDKEKLKEIIQIQGANKNTALHYASMNSMNTTVNQLLEHFRDDTEKLKEITQIKDSNGKTALHYASVNGHNVTVNQLLKHLRKDTEKLKEIIQIKDTNGNTPLHCVFYNDHYFNNGWIRKRFTIGTDGDKHTDLLGEVSHEYCQTFEVLLMYAKKCNDNWETLKQLLESTNTNGDRPFDLARDKTRTYKIIENFLEQANKEKAPLDVVTLLENIKQDLDGKNQCPEYCCKMTY